MGFFDDIFGGGNNQSEVQDSSGNVSHVRETSSDGRHSELYKADNSLSGILFSGGKGEKVEVADHHSNGTTDAYKPDESFWGTIFNGGKGEHK